MQTTVASGPQRARLRAILIDPYAGSREGLRASLEAEGCLVETASDAPHAAALIQGRAFDLGVLDLDLVPASGIARSAWEVARVFRALNPSAPLVLLASELPSQLEIEAACVCPALLLEKPISPAYLRTIVRSFWTTDY